MTSRKQPRSNERNDAAMTGQTQAPAGVTRWRVRDRALVMEAHQWYKNGDHPDDNCHMITPDRPGVTEPFLSEGEVVRYFRRPDIYGDSPCPQDCGSPMHYHGWIDQGGGRTVCPGDWIVSLPLPSVGTTAYFPVKPDVFSATREPASNAPGTVSVSRQDLRVVLLAKGREAVEDYNAARARLSAAAEMGE